MKNYNLLAATFASAVVTALTISPAMADDADKTRAETAQADRSTGQAVDDAAIVAKVKSGLLGSPDVEGLDVNVDARNGVVTLSGTADSVAERSSAERIAKAADGVKSVDNKIVVKSGSSDVGSDISAPSSAPTPVAPNPAPPSAN
jgi:hyperosmotically inducible protein